MNEYIQEMIDWIEARLKDKFSLEELAAHMGYSPYYCSFKFHQATGMSMRRYILLRRLYQSMHDLKMPRKIIDVALDYHYSSQESYSRAFKTVFGSTPREFQLQNMPVQSIAKLLMKQEERKNEMETVREHEVIRLQNEARELFDRGVLNILNGQMMYEEFVSKKLMGDSDYAPFNEAMCVHETTDKVFSSEFIQIRAAGHGETVEAYQQKVVAPLQSLLNGDYHDIVLWFGEDMFCQMNLLTILAYLEQSGYQGRVFYNSFREDEFKVEQTELKLGNYDEVYQTVMIRHMKPDCTIMPVLYQAIDWYVEMLKADNPVTRFIAHNHQLPTDELLKRLFSVFPMIGYGDTQYMELINHIDTHTI